MLAGDGVWLRTVIVPVLAENLVDIGVNPAHRCGRRALVVGAGDNEGWRGELGENYGSQRRIERRRQRPE